MHAEIKKAGYRLTEPRKEVVDAIRKKDGIFSASELMGVLRHIDRVSLYRTLDLLARLDLIHPILFRHGELHYERHDTDHHHHIVCNQCEKTSCIDCDINHSRHRVRGFKHIHHSFILTGLCAECTSD